LLDVIAINKAPESLFDQKNVKHVGRGNEGGGMAADPACPFERTNRANNR
jgi:hypothetical protein